MRMQSSVSVSVPIWLSLMRMALATPASMPRRKMLDVRDEDVVAHELDLAAEPLGAELPAVPVVLREAVLDAEMMGYLLDERLVDARRALPGSMGFLSNVYLPVFLSKNSLAAQSSATKMSLPGL